MSYLIEAKSISAAEATPWTGITLVVHTKTSSFISMGVQSIDFESNYIKSWTDYLLVEATFTMAEFRSLVMANRSVLEAVLTKGPQGTMRYRCVVVPTTDMPHEDVLDTVRDVELDRSLITITLQLVNMGAEALSMTYTRGVYQGLSRDALVSAMVADGISQCQSEYSITKLIVHPTDNTNTITQAIIPSHTPVLKSANYVQNHLGGVYTGGINLYVSMYEGESSCFIYPPTTNRWEETPNTRKLILWDLFDKSANKKVRTYNYYPSGTKQLHAIVTKEVITPEAKEGRSMVRADGFRRVSPSSMMKGMLTSSPMTVTSSGGVDTAVIVNKRDDDLNVTPNLENPIATNDLVALSAIKANHGRTFTFTWQHSNPVYLYPGMPIKIMSETKTGFVTRYGSLVYQHSSYTRAGGLTGTEYAVATLLVVFVAAFN